MGNTHSATYQPPDNENMAQTVERLSRLSTGVTIVDELSVPIARNGKGDLVSLEHFQKNPSSIRQSASLSSVQSFIDYVLRHKNEDSIVLSDRDGERFTFIADYHGKDGSPHWGRHSATLRLTRTTSMENWVASHNKQMAQEPFGLFIEENANDIVSPAAATMLQIATEMKARNDVEFESKVNLDNGSFVFGFKENVSGTYNNGQTSIPTDFQLGFVPYRGMTDAFKLDAKFRYRISSRKLLMWYTIPLLDRMIEQAFDGIVKQIGEGIGGLPIYEGSISNHG